MTSKNMATLYQIINKEYGRSEARKTVEAMISNVIFDLQQEGKEVSSENLDLGIEKYTQIFLEAVSKSKSA